MRLYFAEEMLRHDPGPGHPERPERLRALREELLGAPIAGAEWRAPRSAPTSALELVHAPNYIERVLALRGARAPLDADTSVSAGSVEAALLAAGALVDAVDAVLTGETRRAFALVRPPGHHAERDRAMGFCLFDNIAIGAEHALAAHGCDRVLVVDWDVHHGNGTQHCFEARRDVLTIDAHQFPFWPGTGALAEVGTGAGVGHTVNLPFPAHHGDGDYALAFRKIVAPIARQYEPELILVSAGFDAHRGDPLAAMDLSAAGFAHMAGVLCELSEELTGGRLIFTLEGGYRIDSLVRSVRACIEVASGVAAAPAEVEPASDSGRRVVADQLAVHRQYWNLDRT